MALKPDTNFAGKINPATSAYPYGSARNVTTQDDGTGTPFIDLLINDNFGWQQALLDEAGIIPSGSPDSKTTSQYLDAWKSIFYENSKIADRVALSGNAVFTDTTQFATGTTKDGVISDATLLALVGSSTKCRTEDFHAGTTVGGAPYKFLNGADSAAAGYVDGSSRFQIRSLDVYACLVVEGTVKLSQFGADPHGVIFPTSIALLLNPSLTPVINTASDSTAAIQAAINYCAPYIWAGSVESTKRSLGAIAEIKDVGNYRVTDTILINPFVSISGVSNGAFFSDGSSLNIWGDFTDNSKYLLDTAPMNNSGSRPTSASYSRTDWDSGNLVGCMGWSISNLNAQMVNGLCKGVLNRQVAMESVVRHCRLGSADRNYEGIKTEVTWGGKVHGNNIVASAYCLLNGDDVTVDDQKSNYLSVFGTKPDPTDYVYVPWPNIDLQNMSACIISRFADPHIADNICEGAEIGFAATSGSVRDRSNYYEAISNYIYALHTCDLDAEPSYIYCQGAKLVSVRGGSTTKVKINLNSCDFTIIDSIGFIDSFVRSIQVDGSEKLAAIPFNNRVVYLKKNPTINDIYVSSSGDDSSTGFTSTYPVLTIQRAISRCVKGLRNVIHILNSETISTTYSLDGVSMTDAVYEGVDVEIDLNGGTIVVGQSFNQTHCIPLRDSFLTIKNGTLDLSSSAMLDNYRSFLRTKNGTNKYTLESVTISGSGAVIFGSQYNNSGNALINMYSVTLGSGVVFAHNSGQAKSFAWVETSSGITDNGSVVGSASDGLIFSTHY